MKQEQWITTIRLSSMQSLARSSNSFYVESKMTYAKKGLHTTVRPSSHQSLTRSSNGSTKREWERKRASKIKLKKSKRQKLKLWEL